MQMEYLANSEDTDQTADLGLHCLPRPIRAKSLDHYGISWHWVTTQGGCRVGNSVVVVVASMCIGFKLLSHGCTIILREVTNVGKSDYFQFFLLIG